MHSRRDFLVSLPALAIASAAFGDCARTSRAIEGPYWRAGAPNVANLRAGLDGDPLRVRGVARDLACAPLANAVVEIWQADARGMYDHDYGDGRTFLRASLRTDAQGRYAFETIRPAPYGMARSKRPAHIHFKVRAAGRPELVTQLYFHDDPYLDRDPLDAVRPDLIVKPVRGECVFDLTF